MSYEGLDEEEKVETVLTNNVINNYYNVITDFESDQKAKKIFLDGKLKMKLKWPLRPHSIKR